jgi:signal transduction histidine kinase
MLPGVLLLPMLFWLTARYRPAYVAAAVSVVSLIFVVATVFGIGHFGDIELSIDERIAQAQATILFVVLSALVLAALFEERRQNEARLARANVMLERERDNKLMNVQAVLASIAHEVKQPLAALASNASAGLRWLGRTPPNLGEARETLNRYEPQVIALTKCSIAFALCS